MSETPGTPFVRWSADHAYQVIGPGVESAQWKFDDPVEDLSASTLLALQTGTNRFVTRPITSGLGDVVGPAGATDNALARYDGPSGTLIQNSVVTLDDAGGLAGVSTINGEPVAVLANEGGGAEVFHTGTPGTLRTLVGTANGLTATQNATTITLDNTLTGANPSVTPGAAGVFSAKSGAALTFRSLVAGVNVVLSPGVPTADDITIAADAAPAPNNLAVYVSAAGDDVTGDGTAGNPYLKIERALDDVRAQGWNDTAAVRILSTGGPFAWPANLNATPGARGRQRLPLTIQGWNGNPNPGRTLVFSQAVVSTSQDPISNIVDVVGPGPYTAAQVGQRIRFTSGILANFPFAPTVSVAVDVAIAAVPNGTTLRLTWASTPPAPGDTFVIEALDTIATVGALSTLRSADRLVLDDLILAGGGAPFVGLLFLGGATLQLSAANFVASASTFVFTGFDDGLITGGDFSDVSLAGFAVTTKSLFVDARGGGAFTTLIEDGPESADFALQFAGFVGAGFLAFDGRLAQSYVDGPSLLTITSTVANFVGLSPASGATARFGAVLELSGVTAGAVSFTQGGRGVIQGLAITGGTLDVSSGGAAWGGGITFSGAPPANWLTVQFGGDLQVAGDLTLPPGSGGFVAESSSLRVLGQLTASGGPGVGLAVSGGSYVHVLGDSAFSSNVGAGLALSEGSRFISAASVVANSNGGDGVQLADSELTVAGELGCQSNTGYGVDAAHSLVRAGTLLPQSNGQSNLRAVGSVVTAGGDFGADANTSGPAVLLDAASRLSAAAYHSAGAAGEGLVVTGGSTAAVSGDLAVTGAGAPTAGVVVSGGSALEVAGTLTSSASAVGAGVLVTDGSGLTCGAAGAAGGLLIASTNAGGAGLSVAAGATATVQSCQCLSNNGSGVLVATGGRFFAAASSSVAECSLNAGDGITLAGRATAYVTAATSAAGANAGYGAQVLAGSKMQLAPVAQSVTGASGDVKVGVNPAATWANIATGSPAFVADFLSGQNPTQMCEACI